MRRCEERSDAAIHVRLGCFATLAMTNQVSSPDTPVSLLAFGEPFDRGGDSQTHEPSRTAMQLYDKLA